MSMEILMKFCDLVQLADTNKSAALSKFQREFHSIPFALSEKGDCTLDYSINANDNRIEIRKYAFFKEFIDNFGHLVKDLLIDIDHNSNFDVTNLFNYVIERCTSLKELHLISDFHYNVTTKEDPLFISTAFPSLESLCIENMLVEIQMKLDDGFPNLKSLQLLSACVVTKPASIEVPMSNLKHLEVVLPEFLYISDDGTVQLNRDHIENIIRLNPQLSEIKFGNEVDIPFINLLGNSLPMLRTLSLAIFDFDAYDGADVVLVNLEHLQFWDLSDVSMVPPIISENLISLDIKTGSNMFAFEFIKKHKSLQILILECEYDVDQILDLFGALPHLKEVSLDIVGDEFWSTNDVMHLLKRCECLDNVEVVVRVFTENRVWCLSLGNIWEIEEDAFHYYCFKKKESCQINANCTSPGISAYGCWIIAAICVIYLYMKIYFD